MKEQFNTVIMLLLILCGCYTSRGLEDIRVDENDPEGGKGDLDPDDLPIVLWWDMQSMHVPRVANCPSGNRCIVSSNISLFHKQEIMMYAFYGSTFLDYGLPLPRRDGDLWALIHEESPKNGDWLFSFESTLELFNYTSTFKRESHFPMPTQWLASQDYITSSEYIVPTAEKNRLRREGLAPIVFVHSDCSTPSNREQYIELLQQHIDVDSYGNCMRNKDFPEEYSQLKDASNFMAPEFIKFIARYKFAMSFENAICDDYITEKFWRPFHAGVVPIAMGSPKLKDFIPRNKSVIFIEDFKTVRDLTGFIKELDADDEQYEAYLKFKDAGISNSLLLSEIHRLSPEHGVQHYGTTVQLFECFTCDKLYEAIHSVGRGETIPKSKANLTHFGCPLPTQKFDDLGRYVPDPNRDREVRFYEINAKLFRDLYDNSENITSSELTNRSTEMELEEQKLKVLNVEL